MKLLVITQKVDVNDDNLGFFHRWLEKLAGKVEELRIICLVEGENHLPRNTRVFSLGKEKGYPKIWQLFRLQKFLLKNLPEADGVFIHMCPIYAVASWLLVKIFRKKMILWYMHKSVNFKLKLAAKCVDKILTASEESCRLKNRRKIEIVGHGIDTDLFRPKEPVKDGISKILCVGRISKIKDQETLIKAIDILINEKNFQEISVKFIGNPLAREEKDYDDHLKSLVQERNLEKQIQFLAGVPYGELPQYYQNTDLVVNLSHTGSMDKVVLEAMVCATPVLTCNEAFQNVLDEKYFFKKKDPHDLAEKIINLRGAGKDVNLRKIVVEHHNLDNLIVRIIAEFQND